MNPDDIQSENGFRFSLGHMAAVLTGVAVAVAMPQVNLLAAYQPSPKEPVWKELFQAIPILVQGVLLGACGYIVVEAIRNGIMKLNSWIPHPGYLLLISSGVGSLGTFVLFRIIHGNLELQAMGKEDVAQLLQLLWLMWGISAATALLKILGVFRFRWWWRLAFLILVANSIVGLYRGYLQLPMVNSAAFPRDSITAIVFWSQVNSILMFTSAVWMFICLVIDLIGRHRHDWIHHVGWISWYLLSFAMMFLTVVASRYLGATSLYPQLGN